MKGHLEVITGPMFSGKSEELLRRIRRAQIAELYTVVFKPAIENRSERIHTHSGYSQDGYYVYAITNANEIYKYVGADGKMTTEEKQQVICIDEAQFFELEMIIVVQKLVEDGNRVIVSGLDQDFRQEPFGPMPELLALADFIVKLRAVCVKCGKDATTTQRLVNGEPASYDGDTILVGAKDSYEARCRECHERG